MAEIGYILIAAGSALTLALAAVGALHLSQLRSPLDSDAPDPSVWPKVSVIVPARNEADVVEEALRTRLEDDYPDLEIVFVDDRSEDGTGERARRVAGADPRFSMVRIDELPDGWVGKVNALAKGVERSTGEWLLLSDADVHVCPGALRRAVAHAQAEGLDLVALIPEYVTRSLIVTVFWTIFMTSMLLMRSPKAVRDAKSPAALGSGAFNLVRRSALARTEGFEWLRFDTADDMSLGLMVKSSGGRIEAMNGRGAARVEIYRSVRGFITGIEKNGATTAAHPWRFTVVLAIFVWIQYSPLVALFVGPVWLRVLGGIALAAFTALNVACLWTNTGRRLAALAWPVGTLFFALATLRATWLVYLRRGVLWRGTLYPLADIHAARRFEF